MMEKKNYNYKGLVKQSFYYITRALNEGKNISEIKSGIRSLINSYRGLTKNERAVLYNAIYKVARAARSTDDVNKSLSLRRNYDSVLSAARKVYAYQRLRIKKGTVRAELSNSSGTVFFLCSKHNNCADDHKDYQGKIYIDRFWRQKVSGLEYSAVLDFIKKNDVMTIQEAMSNPIWLCTRPYCRHHFIPMPINEVIGAVQINELIEDYNMKHRFDLYDSDDYYELRSRVYQKLNDAYPCKYFKEKIRGK